jgi:hypothetical protein
MLSRNRNTRKKHKCKFNETKMIPRSHPSHEKQERGARPRGLPGAQVGHPVSCAAGRLCWWATKKKQKCKFNKTKERRKSARLEARICDFLPQGPRPTLWVPRPCSLRPFHSSAGRQRRWTTVTKPGRQTQPETWQRRTFWPLSVATNYKASGTARGYLLSTSRSGTTGPRSPVKLRERTCFVNK